MGKGDADGSFAFLWLLAAITVVGLIVAIPVNLVHTAMPWQGGALLILGLFLGACAVGVPVLATSVEAVLFLLLCGAVVTLIMAAAFFPGLLPAVVDWPTIFTFLTVMLFIIVLTIVAHVFPSQDMHEHNVGYYCRIIPRRAVLEVVAGVVFLRYAGEIVLWLIFAQDQFDRDRHEGSHCFGIRCPSVFTCTYQHETSLIVRYAAEVLLGSVCALVGLLGAVNWNSGQIRVFAYYLLFSAALTVVLGGWDYAYVDVCGAYPANMVATMPVLGQVHGGRVKLAELHMVATPDVDEVFGYHLTAWYLWRSFLFVVLSLLFAHESLAAADYFVRGQLGFGDDFGKYGGPNFKLGHAFDVSDRNVRPELRRIHYSEPVAAYGTLPESSDPHEIH
jgi:hypothetical protein